MAKEPNITHATKQFCRWHLGRDCFAPFTGQDYPAWCAFVHLVECWTRGGGDFAIEAMRATVRCAQPTTAVLRCFVQAIPAIGDWSHVRELWPRVAIPILMDDKASDARELHAIERAELGGGVRVVEHGWLEPVECRTCLGNKRIRDAETGELRRCLDCGGEGATA